MKRDMMQETTMMFSGATEKQIERRTLAKREEQKLPGNHRTKPKRNKLAKKSRARNRKK